MLTEQVRTLKRRLDEAKAVRRPAVFAIYTGPDTYQLLKEQDALIDKNSKPEGGSASQEQVRALQQEIVQLKVSHQTKPAALQLTIASWQSEHAKTEQRYRHEKLVMLKAWNDLGQRTMKAQDGSANTSSAGWLRVQRQSVSLSSLFFQMKSLFIDIVTSCARNPHDTVRTRNA